jgi:iduronate 2-sulfatase
VELLDLYPTLAEACGIPAPAGFEGRSLMPILNDPSKPGKSAVYTMVGRNEDRNLSHKQPTYFGKSVRTDRWRYTEWDGGKRGHELYDHQNDPKEMHNLISDPAHKQVVLQLHQLLG